MPACSVGGGGGGCVREARIITSLYIPVCTVHNNMCVAFPAGGRSHSYGFLRTYVRTPFARADLFSRF